MPVYFEYLLKASAGLAFIYLSYILLLKRVTYYKLNRYFLLIYSALSLIVPLISVNVLVEFSLFSQVSFSKIPVLQKIAGVKNTGINPYSFDFWKELSVILTVGSVIMIIRFIMQFVSLKKLQLTATLMQEESFRIYHLSSDIPPFSFLNNIYVNKDRYSVQELTEIVEHERVHVEQNHSIDMLIAEIICVLNWYNPFAWLIKKAIQENLEFIADDAVIKKGADKKSYQYLLLKVTGETPCTIVNGLRFSSLKNRISMMNKTKTGKLHVLKFVLLIPALSMILLAFRNKHEKYTSITREQSTVTKTYILSSLTYSIPDTKVEAAVKKEENKCLLKTGEALNLDLIYNEKTRLKSLLENSGYKNIGEHAITFMIDTTLGNNNFSIQININPQKNHLSLGNEQPLHSENNLSTSAGNQHKSITETAPVKQLQTADAASETKGKEIYKGSLYHSAATAVK